MSYSENTPDWVKNRIMGFFNRAQNVNDILDGSIQDDPTDGPGNTLGRTLAARIIRTKNTLPKSRFTDFNQVANIQGIGQGTLDDLVFSFGDAAAEYFRTQMYANNVIYEENWPLQYYRTVIEDKNEFTHVISDPERLKEWVAGTVKEYCESSKRDCSEMLSQLQNAYIDQYHNSSPTAAYALALWFYEFDADNWFSWERIQEQTLKYFDYHMGAYPWYMELYFFKGVKQNLIKPGICPDDLVMVVNWPERAITIWVSALYD